MRHIIRKMFWVWDFDKEEKWLNEMAAKGLCLVSVGFCRYEFEDCTPGEYAIRMERLEKSPKKPESRNYINFMEETGAEQVGAFSTWVYFRKKTADGPFEIFSDLTSRIKHLKQIIRFILSVTILNLIVGIENVYFFFTRVSENIFFIHGIGFLNLFLSILAFFGIHRLMKKKKRLEKEKQIFE